MISPGISSAANAGISISAAISAEIRIASVFFIVNYLAFLVFVFIFIKLYIFRKAQKGYAFGSFAYYQTECFINRMSRR